MSDLDAEILLSLTADIVAAHVANNKLSPAELPALIGAVHAALAGLGAAPAPVEAEPAPAVSIRASVRPDHITCLEDGKKMKMLKRHLATDHGMTPEQYRAKWKLPADYPLVAPNYAEKRRALAVSIGLGQKKRAAPVAAPKGKAPRGKTRSLKFDG
nr:MucR family transcriptional regulator [Sphingomonas sp. Y57]